MKREFLEGLGFEKDAIDKIMAEHGKSVNALKEKSDSVEGLNEQIEDYKQQLSDRDTQLEELKKIDAEGLQQKIQNLQTENENNKNEYQDKLDAQAFEFKLDKALTGAKVKNAKAVRALLDTDVIKQDGDKLLNLDDQLDKLKESDAYLFDQEEQRPEVPTFTTGKHQSNGGENNPFTAILSKYEGE